MNPVSKYLSEVLNDWQASRDDFPLNASSAPCWPIPFFGNPVTAALATVGVNPSGGEFRPDRNWDKTRDPHAWKLRLKEYFNRPHSIAHTPPHEWFEPWTLGLELIGLSYKAGTAAHFDISYRPTTAMLRNRATDAREFRRMVERDVAWFFRLLPLCPDLRLLLTFGPLVREDGSKESLARFLVNQAPRHDFTASRDGIFWVCKRPGTGAGNPLFIHEVSWPGEKCVTCGVIKNLSAHRDRLRQILGLQPNSPPLQ